MLLAVRHICDAHVHIQRMHTYIYIVAAIIIAGFPSPDKVWNATKQKHVKVLFPLTVCEPA